MSDHDDNPGGMRNLTCYEVDLSNRPTKSEQMIAALRTQLATAQAEVEKLKEALSVYGSHSDRCRYHKMNVDHEACICRLSDALENKEKL